MVKVVVDTNVLVSALLQKSFPYLIIHQLVFNNQIQLCISNDLLKEYFEVLNRKKFTKYPDFRIQAEITLFHIERFALNFKPDKKVKILPDSDDNFLLELIEKSKPDYLITGNLADFPFRKFKRTRIVSPKEFWDKFSPQ